MGNFSKPVATIILPKLLTFLYNCCKGFKNFHFSCEIIFWATVIDIWRLLTCHTAHDDRVGSVAEEKKSLTRRKIKQNFFSWLQVLTFISCSLWGFEVLKDYSLTHTHVKVSSQKLLLNQVDKVFKSAVNKSWHSKLTHSGIISKSGVKVT